MATARLWLSEMAASFAAEQRQQQQQQEAPSLCITRKYLTHTHTYIYSIVYRVICISHNWLNAGQQTARNLNNEAGPTWRMSCVLCIMHYLYAINKSQTVSLQQQKQQLIINNNKGEEREKCWQSEQLNEACCLSI